jgi:hypothetical protein
MQKHVHNRSCLHVPDELGGVHRSLHLRWGSRTAIGRRFSTTLRIAHSEMWPMVVSAVNQYLKRFRAVVVTTRAHALARAAACSSRTQGTSRLPARMKRIPPRLTHDKALVQAAPASRRVANRVTNEPKPSKSGRPRFTRQYLPGKSPFFRYGVCACVFKFVPAIPRGGGGGGGGGGGPLPL